MPRTSIAQKLLLVVASLAFTVLALELGLRAASVVYGWSAGDGGPLAAPAAREDEYRILCLGESTTRGYGVKPYPLMLEEMLRDRFAIPVRVVNAGFTSEHSLTLVERVPALLDRFDPHAVVVMMGVNDPFYFGETDSGGVGLETELLLLRSRLYKLLRLLWFNARARFGPATAGGRAAARFDSSFRESHRAWSQGRLADPEQRFRAFLETARAAGERAPGGSLAIPAGYRFQYLNAHLALARAYLDAGRPERALAVYQEAVALHPRIAFFERGLAGVYEELGDEERAALHRARARELATAHAPLATRVAFRQLRGLVEDAGVAAVLMQYPLREVALLEGLWGPASEAHFVDNEAGFREAVARLGWDALFTDRFAGDFGHCTAEGNRLIAENLVKSVFAPIFEERARR